jgi:hypothetical protein
MLQFDDTTGGNLISDSLLVAFDNSPMFLSSSEYVCLLSPCIVVYAYYDLSVIHLATMSVCSPFIHGF